MEELLSLKWNNHRTTFIHILGVLRDKQAYTDVTLACDGKFYSVHKLVLSTCSDYFCAMFDKTACKSPVIVLKDIKCEDLEALLDYMYLGEVNVRQCDLASLIKAAENLRIKGLAVPDDEPPNKGTVAAPTSRSEPVRRDGGSGSPPTKRKRRDEGEDGREDVRPPPPSQGSLHTPPPPSRPKSPVSQRLSPSPHRTSQESPILEDRTSRPLSSPVEQPPPAPRASSQPPAQSSSSQPPVNQYTPDETPSFVKVEMEEEQPDDMHGDSYDLSTDGYKEEGDESGSGMNSDLPEFLQAAASGALASSTASYPHHSFAGPSGYQPGDLAGWQGDGASLGFPAHLNFTSDSSSQQNAPGEAAHGAAEGVATRMLACPMCTKVFHGTKRKYRLDRHMLVHWGLKPFKCPHCPYRSTQQNNLNRHMKNVHFQIIGPMQESGVTLQANSAISNRPGLLHHEGSQDLNEDYLQEAERNVEGPVSCGTLSHHSDNHVEQDAGGGVTRGGGCVS
ncbi:longitudinals lacking protein, isoforms A/B/D/L-like isoform X2 [Homarus americanus]|uniref:longitudinals lacking protein, isoforms A/B/D/L-like isoform X2 n=1 Tax=Homarus americanus TaxID=6706 RepID=UPI001C4569AA|nr:longitudinals lacking protein, isoforms A/B/D/L-like isoform X2 [Homarus americanus]